MITQMNQPNRIKMLMAERGWNIYQLAAKSGLTPQALDRYFRGKTTKLQQRTKGQLAKVFGISIDELFNQ